MSKILFHFLCCVCIFLIGCDNYNIFSWAHKRMVKPDANASYESLLDCGEEAMRRADFEKAKECFRLAANREVGASRDRATVLRAGAAMVEVTGGSSSALDIIDIIDRSSRKTDTVDDRQRIKGIVDRVKENAQDLKDTARSLTSVSEFDEKSTVDVVSTFALAVPAEFLSIAAVKNDEVVREILDKALDSKRNPDKPVTTSFDKKDVERIIKRARVVADEDKGSDGALKAAVERALDASLGHIDQMSRILESEGGSSVIDNTLRNFHDIKKSDVEKWISECRGTLEEEKKQMGAAN